MSPPWKGKHLSEEHKRKIGESQKGKQITAIQRQHMSESQRGRHPTEEQKKHLSESLTGKKKPPRTKEHCKHLSESLMGKMKGVKHTEEHTRHMSESLKGRVSVWKDHKRPPFTEESKRRMSEAHKGLPSNMKGKHHTEHAKQLNRIARLNRVYPTRDTSIEIKMQKELAKRGIIFEKHLPVCNICQPDIVFPDKKIVIFCDGDYWHNRPGAKERDVRQNKILIEAGYEIFRFKESEINADVQACVDRLVFS